MMKKLNYLFLSTFILTGISACSDPYAEICAEYETAISELDVAKVKINLATEKINNLRNSYNSQVSYTEDPDNPILAELETAQAEYRSLETNLEFANDIAREATESYNAALSSEKKPACVKRHAEAACESAKTARAKYRTALEVSPVEILRTAQTEYETLQSQSEASQAELEVKLEVDFNDAIRGLAGFAKTEYDEAKAQNDAARAEYGTVKTNLDTIKKAKEADVAKAEAKFVTAKAEYDAAKANSSKAASDIKARVNAIHDSVSSKYRAALRGLEARTRAKENAARNKYDAASLKEDQMYKTHGSASTQGKNARREKEFFDGEWRTAKSVYDAAKRAVRENNPNRLVDSDIKYEADIKAANAELEAANKMQADSAGTNMSTVEAKLAEAEADVVAARTGVYNDTRAVEIEVAEASDKVRIAEVTYKKLERDIQLSVLADNALLVQKVESLNTELQKAKNKYEAWRNNPRSAADASKEAFHAARDLAKKYAVTHGYVEQMSMPCW